jgi:molecular chaperone GrpE
MNEAIESIDLTTEDEFVLDGVPSLDDFMRELEEREKQLEISVQQQKDDTRKPSENPMAKNPKETSSSALTSDFVSNLQNKVKGLEKEKEEFLSTMRRRQLDFDSFKNRVDREKSETFQNLVGKLAHQILPVLDNLDRALEAANSEGSSQRSMEYENFVQGIALVSQQLFDVLTDMGVETIPTIGQPFDPHFHEAVAMEPSEEFDANVISSELRRGYRVGTKVIRASMVKVSS